MDVISFVAENYFGEGYGQRAERAARESVTRRPRPSQNRVCYFSSVTELFLVVTCVLSLVADMILLISIGHATLCSESRKWFDFAFGFAAIMPHEQSNQVPGKCPFVSPNKQFCVELAK